MIEARDIRVGYGGNEVLHGVSVGLAKGRITGLLGPNGSGKTTLMRAMAAVLPLMSGEVSVRMHDGTETAMHSLGARDRARLVAGVPQRMDTTFALRCSTVVLMGRFAHQGVLGGTSPEDREAAREAMRATGVEHLWDRSCDAVSGGELQRVLFARALAQEADAMLLDEPTASMDLAGTVRLFDLLSVLAGQGKAVMCAMHDLNLAALYCDELVFLKEGLVAGAGPVQDVFNERTLTDIYGTDIRVAEHPATGAPQAHFVPGACAPGASVAAVFGDSDPA